MLISFEWFYILLFHTLMEIVLSGLFMDSEVTWSFVEIHRLEKQLYICKSWWSVHRLEFKFLVYINCALLAVLSEKSVSSSCYQQLLA